MPALVDQQTQIEAAAKLLGADERKPLKAQPKQKVTQPTQPAVTPKVETRSSLSQAIRAEVQSANREWLAQLLQGLNAYLQPDLGQPVPYSGATDARTNFAPTTTAPEHQPNPRFLQGQASGAGASPFNLFVFGNKDHAYAAGDSGLYRAQLQAAQTAPFQPTVITTKLAQDKIKLNGIDNIPSPDDLGKEIAHLALYGDNARPVVIPQGEHRLYAALDDEGTQFLVNDTKGAAGKIYDANDHDINQQPVALTAARTQDRFFVAVADGKKADRTLYQRPDDLQSTVRDGITKGVGYLKAPGNVDLSGALATTAQALTPSTVVPPTTDKTEAYVKALVDKIDHTLFLSGIDAGDATAASTKFAQLAFRDAINLRKGGLIDLGTAAANKKIKPADQIKDLQTIVPLITPIDNLKTQIDKPATLQLTTDANPNVLAGAISLGLAGGIHDLAAAKTAATLQTDKLKTFASLDSRKAGSPTTDINIYVADQDGAGRSVAVVEPNTNNTALVTKDAKTAFLVKPGKLATQAIPEGLDPAAKIFDNKTLSINDVGIPCIAYAAADPYCATRAMISGDVNLCWDDQLQRLFVGFEDIALGDDAGYLTNGSGAVSAIMVGQEKKLGTPAAPALYFQPVISNFGPLMFQKNLTPDKTVKPVEINSTDFITGFYQLHDKTKLETAKADDDLHASAKKLRIMHTSTGKDYLLFNGGVATQATIETLNAKMYALPLVGAGNDATGQLAAAGRGADFFTSGLDNIDFDKPVGTDSPLIAIRSAVETALAEIQKNGSPEAKALNAELIKNNDVRCGMASLATQACYAKIPGSGAPITKDAASNAFTALNTAGYTADPIQQNGLLEKIESIGLDIAVTDPNNPAKWAPAQAPASELAKFITDAKKIQDVADLTVGKSVADIWDIVKTSRSVGGATLNVDTANLGTAGGVAAVEGGLGWAIHEALPKRNDLIAATATMHTDADLPAFDYVRVGSDYKRLSSDGSALIRDVQVVGDTVYVTLGDTRNAAHTGEAGVFASRAIFHHSGFVRAWTPWQRVMGHNSPVDRVAFDPTASRFWYTTSQNANPLPGSPAAMDAVRTTVWGRGYQPESMSTADARLSTLLDTLFGDIGGLFSFYSFGPDTVGFKQRTPESSTLAQRHEQFSMSVATGNGRVAIIKTGGFDSADKIFKPTTEFAQATNVFVFDAASENFAGTALGNIGIITCVEVSRLSLDAAFNRSGWLFVGGTNGLAVLTRWYNGKGWNTTLSGGLDDLRHGVQRDDFPGGEGWRFMQLKVKDNTGVINPFKDVRKIVSDGAHYLYVMTGSALWRIDMKDKDGAYSQFKREQVAAGNAARADIESVVELDGTGLSTKVQKVADLTIKEGVRDIFTDKDADQFLDMLVGYRDETAGTTQLIVATTKGLFWNDAPFADGAVPAPTWTRLAASTAGIAPSLTDGLKGPAMRLDFTPSQPTVFKKPQGSNKAYADGNLQVTAFDQDKKYLAAYRFNLSTDNWDKPTKVIAQPFVEPYLLNGDKTAKTPYFYKIGDMPTGSGDKLEFSGPFDYYPRTAHVPGSADGFADGVWMMPQPADFVRTPQTDNYEDIDIGLDLTLPLYLGSTQIEPATGAQIVAGEWGLRVND
jgi:hypothetical protein